MWIRSQAPLRLAFSGDGTDVEPYLSTFGGLVLNAAIDKYAHVTLRLHDGERVNVRSLDYNREESFDPHSPSQCSDELGLVKSTLLRVCPFHRQGMEIAMRSDVRPGTGLGGSSSMAVALVALFRQWRCQPLVAQEIAETAYCAERIDMQIPGGKQDQYAAAFGGFNLLEFRHDGTSVQALALPPGVVAGLEANLLLCHTGTTRHSAHIITAQVGQVETGQADVLAAMDALKRISQELAGFLLRGRLDDFGALLHEAWINKRKMAAEVSNPHIDELYETARSQGALGGKLAGAGAAGYLFFYCPTGCKHRVMTSLARLGVQSEAFSFVAQGVRARTDEHVTGST